MPVTRTFGVTLAALLAGGFFLAACGDDATALSKEDYIAAADAICQASNDEQEPIGEAAFAELDESADTQEFAVALDEAFDEIEPLLDQQIADIRALAPPEADADMIASILDDVESGIDEQIATIEAAAGGDEEALALLESDSSNPTADANRRAREYGLEVCGAEE